MDITKTKATVATLEAGLWVDHIPEMDDLRLKVRPALAPSVAAMRVKLIRALLPSDRDERGDVVFEASERISSDLLTDAVLVGWDNLTVGGVDIPYTPERAAEYLRDPNYRFFRLAVEWAANEASDHALDFQTAALGNSEAPSAGA